MQCIKPKKTISIIHFNFNTFNKDFSSQRLGNYGKFVKYIFQTSILIEN